MTPGSKAIPFGFAANTDATILRTHLAIWVGSDQAAGYEDQALCIGMRAVSDVAFALGITGVPGPFTEGGDDGWMLHKSIFQEGHTAGPALPGYLYVVDSKAMRKLQDGETMALILENHHATESLKFAASVRMLSKVTQY